MESSTFVQILKQRKHERGFTLVELLIVIAILGLLATLGIVNIQRQGRGKTLDAVMLNDARTIKLAMQQYVTGTGNLPPLTATCCYWTTAAVGSGSEWKDLEAVMGLKLPRPPDSAREYYEYRTTSALSGCAGKNVLRMPALQGSARVLECNDGFGGQGSVFVIAP